MSDMAIYIDDLREILGVSEFPIWAAIGKKSFHATRKEEEKHTTPCPRGFYRFKMWVFLPGSWHHIRALTWLKRKGERLV